MLLEGQLAEVSKEIELLVVSSSLEPDDSLDVEDEDEDEDDPPPLQERTRRLK